MKKPLEEVVKNTGNKRKKLKDNLRNFFSVFALGSLIYSCTLNEKEQPLNILLKSNLYDIRKGEYAELSLDEEHQSPYVSQYILEIDYEKDGIIDETINSENPILVSKQFNFVGNAKIYGTLKSQSGKLYKSNLEIRVLPKDAPILTFNTSADDLKKGEYANFKVDGTDPQSDIIEYHIEFDEGDDGSVEEQLNFTSPVDINRKFYSSKVKVRSYVKDATGLRDEKSVLLNLTEDLGLNINFTKDNYVIGDHFTYTFSATNINSLGKKVCMNNQGKDSLSIKFKIDGIEDRDYSFNLEEGLKVDWFHGGLFSMEFLADKIRFKINEKCSVWTERFPLFWFDGPMTYSYPLPAVNLTKTGEYELEIMIKYFINGEDKTHTIYSKLPKKVVR